jgi:hypothetical protein
MTTPVKHHVWQTTGGVWHISWSRLFQGVHVGGLGPTGFRAREAAQKVADRLDRS